MVGTCIASFEWGQGETFGWPLGVTSRDAGNANLPSSLRSPPSYVWFITSLKMSFILMLVFFLTLSSITSLNATLFFYLRGASSIRTTSIWAIQQTQNTLHGSEPANMYQIFSYVLASTSARIRRFAHSSYKLCIISMINVRQAVNERKAVERKANR